MTIAPSPPIDFDALVDKFVRLRDKIKAIETRHKDELAPFKEMRDVLESTLLTHLNSVKADKIGTKHGTVYKTTKDSAALADRSMFWDWVMTNSAWDYLDYKANVTAVREYIEGLEAAAKKDPNVIPAPPPGVTFSSVQSVGVRRASKDS